MLRTRRTLSRRLLIAHCPHETHLKIISTSQKNANDHRHHKSCVMIPMKMQQHTALSTMLRNRRDIMVMFYFLSHQPWFTKRVLCTILSIGSQSLNCPWLLCRCTNPNRCRVPPSSNTTSFSSTRHHLLPHAIRVTLIHTAWQHCHILPLHCHLHKLYVMDHRASKLSIAVRPFGGWLLSSSTIVLR